MIPAHLSALPCGGCRQPTPTTTLQRVGNHFFCPLCREREAARVAAEKLVTDRSEHRWKFRELLDRARRVASLGFLAMTVTGFVVLPAICDPSEFHGRQSRPAHASRNVEHEPRTRGASLDSTVSLVEPIA